MDQKRMDKNWPEGEAEFWREVRDHVSAHNPGRLAEVEKLRNFVDKKLADPNSGFDLFFHRNPTAVAESIEGDGYTELETTDQDAALGGTPHELAKRYPELKPFLADE
jgi:hypothetical protein